MQKLILLIACCLPMFIFSQAYKPGKGSGLYSTGDENIDKGWYFGLGATYMLPYLSEEESIDYTDSLNQLFTQDYAAKPTGNLGLFAEIGMFRMNNKKVINYLDYGLSYKWFRGGEDFESATLLNNSLVATQQTEASYNSHTASLNFNIGNRYDISDNNFLVNGIGLNADYFFITNRDNGGVILGQPHEFVSDFVGELHYFFGMGFKTGKRLIIMPIIETPIFAIYEFNHIKSTHNYFNTRSRPFIIKIRFMILKKGSKSCPPVYNPMGITPDM